MRNTETIESIIVIFFAGVVVGAGLDKMFSVQGCREVGGVLVRNGNVCTLNDR